MAENKKYLPDTSVLIDRVLSSKIKNGEISPSTIFIHKASMAELESQANKNRTTGFLGLSEIEDLRDIGEEEGFEIEFIGKRPTSYDIKNAESGSIDAKIRQVAFEKSAILATSDKVQAEAGKAQGVEVLYVEPVSEDKELQLEDFFQEDTMSVHLREKAIPMEKGGNPGEWSFKPIRDEKLEREEVREISQEIIEQAKARHDGFIEIDRPGSTLVQLGPYRIVMTQPPFSDAWGITAVRPVEQLSLEDYTLDPELEKRLTEHAEGVLIAGSPGEGKSTFARAIAERYAENGNIVKTIEAPRDMILSEDIAQYALSKGEREELHDVLLLSRPDNTIFDEMRNTEDFELFTDLRLAGIGMMGVVHATDPIDAIQRFIGRVELGVIPHIIDTVAFMKGGQVDSALTLSMTVKVPAGMTEADLARPVVEIHDFETDELKYEVYSYGEQTVVVPVDEGTSHSPVQHLAEEALNEKMKEYVDKFEVDIKSDDRAKVFIPEKDIPRIIGKKGKTIEKIENEVGIGIDVEKLNDVPEKEPEEVDFDVEIGRNITFYFDESASDKDVQIQDGDELITIAKVGQDATIKFEKDNEVGDKIEKAINTGNIRVISQ